MKLPDQIQFQGSAQPIPFKPNDLGSLVPSMEKENARREANFREVSEFDLRTRAVAGKAKADNVARDWEALSQFSGTLNKYVQDVVKQTNEDIEIGQMYDVFMKDFSNDPVGQAAVNQEDQALTQAEQQADQVVRTANDVEQRTGDPVMGNQVRQQFFNGTIAGGVAGEQAIAMNAQASYGASLAAFLEGNGTFRLNGKDVSVREAMASGDPRLVQAAIAAGRHEFIRANNLQYITKRTFVKYLMNTMSASEGSIGGAAVRSAIKAQREGQIAEIEGLGYDLSQSTDATGAEGLFHSLSDQFFRRNTGMTRAEANEAAIKAMISGWEDAGNVDALQALLDVPQVPGQANTELRRRYGNLINDAIVRAENRRDDIDGRQVKDIESGMYEQLAGATTQQQRDQIIEQAASQMEAAGQYKEARRLRQERDELSVSGANEFNAANLEEGLRTGAVTAEQVKEARLRGDITPQQEERILRDSGNSNSNETKEDLKNPLFKGIEDAWGDRTENEFLNRVGLKKDMYGRILPGQQSMVTDGEAEILRQQMRNDIKRVTQQTLAMTAGQSESQKQASLQHALKEWYSQNVLDKGGKFFVPEAVEVAGKPRQWDTTAQRRLKNLSNSPVSLSTLRAPRSIVEPVDWSNRVNGGAITPTVRNGFRRLRNDRIFDNQEIKILADSYKQNGSFQQVLQRAATGLGMSPLALLNHQLAANGLEPVKPEAIQLNSGGNGAPTSGVSGANALMSMGFPAKGAAWLAGNIQQESQWFGQRQPWDDGGALSGGLVSWRAGRLQNAEAALGGNISRASNQAQLNYMVQEMRTKYPEAYRLFMNPMATDRQMMRASQLFWGYGVEGERFTYARQIEQRVKQRGRPQRQLGGDAAARTIEAGRQLVAQGVKIWQHPNFDYDRGFVANGSARVGQHSDNSYHYHAQALDIPLSGNGAARLDAIYAFYNRNRARWGVAELLWRVDGHHDHLHIAFK